MTRVVIKNFDNYLVDEFGNVYSLYSNNIKALKTDKDGYKLVNLSKNKKVYTKKVHRLVAEAFLSNPNKYKEVNHKDGNKANNHADNLEWVSHKQNIIHSYKYGLHKKYKGKDNKNSKQVIQIKNGNIINVFDSITDASVLTVISLTSICRCCKGKFKHAGGFQWKYKDC